MNGEEPVRGLTDSFRHESAIEDPVLMALPLGDLLDRLPVLDARVSASTQELRAWVALLRRRRASWREIGDALHVSRQAAWQRFHDSAPSTSETPG